ncbi:hypothetical protein [Aequorivita ciconiae]|uniref:hypothetical protein n=1 Tax=Aequorivita ciconiae TaxID=2494375 RepID=UPI0013E2B4A0|nr:hypothetical protein [Aequorivita sp. H23M31]
MVDQERHPDGYNDRNPDVRDPDFKYDNYGNLIADKDKEIKEIVYNPAWRASVRQVSGRQAPEPSR